MTEFELIAKLIPTLPVNASVMAGAGDDCAALDMGIPGRLALFKTDAVVEGAHFTKDAPPRKVGHKALGRCLSDIAAMGGTPAHALVTMGLPPEFDSQWVESFYAGLNALARQHGVAVVGGETTASSGGIFVSISALGTVAKDRCILRSGAKVRDAVFVTGELGGSIYGRHLDFEPRVEEGRWLAENFPIHCMMDVSDGLAGDLRHLLNASGVGAELLSSAIPISRAARAAAKAESSNKPPLLAALTDGEDFELLFTVASGNAVALLDAWKARFPETALSCIGRITEAPGLVIRDKNGARPLNVHGYSHFK